MRYAWLGAVLFVIACGGDDDSGGGGNAAPLTPAQAEAPCRRGCEYDAACGSTVGVEACTMNCIDSVSGVWRADAIEIVLACAEQLPCEANDDVCFGEVPPLAIHHQWEERCRVQFAACDVSLDALCEVDPVPEPDDGLLRIVAPALIEELLACAGLADCVARVGCVRDVKTTYGIDF